MAGVNKVILIGNLGADPEVRHLDSGATVATFSLATSESWTGKDGQKQTATEWHRCEVWEGLAKVVEQYCKKGNTLYVEGKLKTEQYEKDGEKRYATKIRVQNLTMLGGRKEGQPAAQAATNQGPEDDLPF